MYYLPSKEQWLFPFWSNLFWIPRTSATTEWYYFSLSFLKSSGTQDLYLSESNLQNPNQSSLKEAHSIDTALCWSSFQQCPTRSTTRLLSTFKMDQDALWEKASCQRQCDALGNVLLGSCCLCRCYLHLLSNTAPCHTIIVQVLDLTSPTSSRKT